MYEKENQNRQNKKKITNIKKTNKKEISIQSRPDGDFFLQKRASVF